MRNYLTFVELTGFAHFLGKEDAYAIMSRGFYIRHSQTGTWRYEGSLEDEAEAFDLLGKSAASLAHLEPCFV